MITCLQCGKPLEGKQRKFCSRDHKNSYNQKHLYGYRYSKVSRARSPRSYLSQLRSYYGRRETLSLDFLEGLYHSQEGLCAVTGEVLQHTQGGGKNPYNMSIDRIDSSLGYLESNVRLVCYQVNLMKMELTDEQLKEWCLKVLNGNPKDNKTKNLSVQSKSQNRSFKRTKSARKVNPKD